MVSRCILSKTFSLLFVSRSSRARLCCRRPAVAAPSVADASEEVAAPAAASLSLPKSTSPPAQAAPGRTTEPPDSLLPVLPQSIRWLLVRERCHGLAERRHSPDRLRYECAGRPRPASSSDRSPPSQEEESALRSTHESPNGSTGPYRSLRETDTRSHTGKEFAASTAPAQS